MAIRTISNTGGNCNATTAWVEGVVPTSNDDVYATSTSGNLTINVAFNCRSLDLSGYTGSIIGSAATITVGSTTCRVDLVCVYIPDNVNHPTVNMTIDNKTINEVTIYVGGVDTTFSLYVYSGKLKLLNNIYFNFFRPYSNNASYPVVINCNAKTLNIVNDFSFNGTYNTIDFTNSTIVMFSAITSYISFSLNPTFITNNTVFIFNGGGVQFTGSTTNPNFGDLSIFIRGVAGTVTFNTNMSVKTISFEVSKTITVAAGKMVTLTGGFCAFSKTGAVTIQSSSGGGFSKVSGIVNMYSVILSNVVFSGGATWFTRHNSTQAGCTGVTSLGGRFYLDYENGNDNLFGGFGWWSVVYTGATGNCPSIDETVTGIISAASAAVTGQVNSTEWAAGTGTLYFYGKVGTFQAETVSLPSGGTFTITGNFITGAWKTLSNGALSARTNVLDEYYYAKNPDPVSIGQNATWNSVFSIGGGLPAAFSITSSTNTSPIIVTKIAHGLVTGSIVLIIYHSINTNANGEWFVTKLTDNTFSLDNSVGNGVGGATGSVQDITPKSVLLTTPVTADICKCDSAWTVGTNVTSAALETSYWKFSAGNLRIITASNCGANQILAKFPLPATLNLSPYKQISFWFQNNTSVVLAGELIIKLYSDTGCTVEVESLTLPASSYGMTSGRWQPVTIDKGASLSPTVNGVALYTTVVQPSKTFFIDNIIACKDSSLQDSITLQSLISKNKAGKGDDIFYAIQSISGRIIQLDADPSTTPQMGRGYCGLTETCLLYKRESFKYPSNVSAASKPNSSGIISKHAIITGGVNKVTNIADGLTIFDGLNGYGTGFYMYGFNYVDAKNFHLLRYSVGLLNGTLGSFDNIIVSNNTVNGFDVAYSNAGYLSNIKGYSNRGAGINLSVNSTSLVNVTALNNGINNTAGVYLYLTTPATINNIISDNNYQGIFIGSYAPLTIPLIISINYNTQGLNISAPRIIVNEIQDCNYNGYGVYYANHKSTVNRIRKLNNNNYGIYWSGFYNVITEIVEFSNSVSGLFYSQGCTGNKILKITTCNNNQYIGSIAGSDNYIYNANFTNFKAPSTFITVTSGSLYLINCNGLNYINGITINSNVDAKIYCHNMNSLNNHFIHCEYGVIQSDTIEKHSTSGISWKFSPTNILRGIRYPLTLSIAKILCTAGVQKTIAIWCKKSHATDIGCRLVIQGNKFEGIGSTASDVFVEAVNVTGWQQISMTFTPTKTEVVEVEFWAYWLANLPDEFVSVDDISIV